jgi:hypothetical protein
MVRAARAGRTGEGLLRDVDAGAALVEPDVHRLHAGAAGAQDDVIGVRAP